jgi:hypothetical protein
VTNTQKSHVIYFVGFLFELAVVCCRHAVALKKICIFFVLKKGEKGSKKPFEMKKQKKVG